MAVGVTDLERAVLEKLLAGDNPTLVTLRTQAERSNVRRREYTGVGFWTFFSVPEDAPAAMLGDVTVGDVHATISGLKHAAGFNLFIHGGRLDWLEGFTHDEAWPEEMSSFELRYSKEPREVEFTPWKRRPNPS